MKQKRSVLPLLGTLLLLALAACLPRLTALALDRRLEQEVVQREDAYISLALAEEQDLFQTLALFRTRQAEISLSAGSRMTEAEAKTAAAALRAELRAAAFAEEPDAAALPVVTPMLVTGGEAPSFSGIFWYCTWRGESLWLDDESGKVVAFVLRATPFALVETGEPDSAILVETGRPNSAILVTSQPQAAAVTDFLRSHYEAEALLLEDNERSGNYLVTLTPGGEQTTCTLPLLVQDGWLLFNV